MSWAEIKKAVNDNLDYPLNKQGKILRQLTFTNVSAFSWTVPQTGVYIVTCVGAGGKGGTGRRQGEGYATGAGAGSGAIAKSKLTLTANSTVSITASSAISSFGSYLSATAGGNATDTYSSQIYTFIPGAGGVASGGNMINVNGLTGSNGGTQGTSANGVGNGASTSLQTPLAIAQTRTNNRGGSGYNPLSFPSRGGTIDGTLPEFGGGTSYGYSNGGSGFGGGGAGSYATTSAVNTAGADGGVGAVIIEYFEEVFG